MNKTEFGKKLKESREAKDESQAQLGKLLNVGVKQIQRYESGLVPSHEDLITLRDHYKYDFISLVYGLQNNNPKENHINNGDLGTALLIIKSQNDTLNSTLPSIKSDLTDLKEGIEKFSIRVDNIESTVYGLQGKVEDVDASLEDLREYVTQQIAKLRKESRTKIQSEMGNVSEERMRKGHIKSTQHG